MLSVSNYRITPSRVSFKANEDQNQGERQVQPFKTHAGLKTGIAASVIAAGNELFFAKLLKVCSEASSVASKDVANDVELANNFKSNAKNFKALSKNVWITLPIAVLASIGCGMFVDSVINKKQAQFADKFNTEGRKAALNDEERAEITKKDNVYLSTNSGKKVGTMLGAIVLPAFGAVKKSLAKVKAPNAVITNAIIGSIGGLILGSITDMAANKGAKKHADKQAQIVSQPIAE